MIQNHFINARKQIMIKNEIGKYVTKEILQELKLDLTMINEIISASAEPNGIGCHVFEKTNQTGEVKLKKKLN